MAYYQSPIAFQLQSFTNQGVILSGGLIYTYLAGTTTPQATYADSGAVVTNANPIVLDSSGRLTTSIWVSAGVVLKIIIKDSSGNTLATVDNIASINDIGSILASPGTIGGTTPGAGNFSSLTVSGSTTFGGNVTGQVVTANTYFTGPIGSATPAAGSFTTVNASSDIFTTQNGSGASLYATSYDSTSSTSAYGNLQLRRGRGTSGSPAAVLSGDALGYIQFFGYSGSAFNLGAYFQAVAESNFSGSASQTYVRLLTAASGTTLSEAVRWTSAGNYYINTTSLNLGSGNAANVGHTFEAAGRATHSASSASSLVLNRLTTDGSAADFYRGGVFVGSISVTGAGTSFNTSSDYRLKMDVAPMTGALALIQQMRPVTYLWINGRVPGSGFIAHELQAVFPGAVNGAKDATDEAGAPVYQGVDFSKLVPTLVCALQEQQTVIEALQARLTSVEQSLSALQPPTGQSGQPAAPQNG
jgi:hypothetical protein